MSQVCSTKEVIDMSRRGHGNFLSDFECRRNEWERENEASNKKIFNALLWAGFWLALWKIRHPKRNDSDVNSENDAYGKKRGLNAEQITGLVIIAASLLIGGILIIKVLIDGNEDINTDINAGAEPVNGAESNSEWAVSPTPVNEFDYKTDVYNKTMLLENYNGSNSKVWIAETYNIDGQDYRVSGLDGTFCLNRDIISVIIPEGITSLENNTFNCCSSLQYIYLPKSMKPMQGYDSIFSFLDDNFKAVYFGGSDEQWRNTTAEISDEEMKYIPVYCNSEVTGNSTAAVTKGELYGMGYASTESTDHEQNGRE